LSIARFAPEQAARLRAQLSLDDAHLLRQCEVQVYRSSGPGGQHRNKVSSAVRLVHRDGGLTVTSTESRSQHENRERAIRRMREAIALHARCPLPTPLRWPANVDVSDGRLRVADRNPSLPLVIGLALDALAQCGGRLSEAAVALGISTSSLARFLHDHPKAWAEANRLRGELGLPALSTP
jgi:hypothetical protein